MSQSSRNLACLDNFISLNVSGKMHSYMHIYPLCISHACVAKLVLCVLKMLSFVAACCPALSIITIRHSFILSFILTRHSTIHNAVYSLAGQ